MEEDKEHKEKLPKRKRRKWLRRLIYLFLSFFILVDVFLFFFATPVLKDYMQEKVQEKTLGLYRIDFDKISIELGSRRISLENFKLIPDTAVYNELLKTGEAKSAIYQISSTSIELWGTGFYKLFFNRHLKATKLLIKNPLVDLKKLPSKKKKTNENRDFIHEDLFPSIEKHIDQLELKYIKLENGKFLLSLNKDGDRNTTHYGFISVSLDRFLLNKKEFEQKSRLFYADDIQISIDDYRLKLGDGIHVMFADSLFVSTKESLLKAKTVGIKPGIELPQYLSALKNNYYYISTPEIKFRNFNISNLFFNQDIEIQNIIVDSPKIKLINKLVKKKTSLKKESKEIDFYKLIKNKLNSITINTLDFKQADFEFYYNSHFEQPSYKIENFNLNLFGFYLDKYSKNDQSRILYSKNIRLNINNLVAKIKNNTHSLSTGKIYLHTDTRNLLVENITLRPIKNKIPKSQLLNIKLSKLDIKGADFYKLYHKKTFSINNLTAEKSSINVKLFNIGDKTKRKPTRVLSGLMGKFINNLYVRNINFKKANFRISSYQKDSLLNRFEGKVNLNLERFHFANSGDSKKSKLLHSDRFKIELFNYSQFLEDHLHILKVDEVYMSNNDSLLRFSSLSIIPKIKLHHKLSAYNKSKLIDLHVESSAVRGIDIQKAYEYKQLIVRDISITKPSIEIFNFVDLNIEADSTYAYELTGDTSQPDSIPVDSLIKINTVTALLSDYFGKIQLDNLTLEKGAFRFNNIDSLDRKDLIMSGSLSVALDHFFYDNETDIEKFGFTNSKNIYLELNDFYRKILDNQYQLKIKKARLSSKDSIFSADIIRLFPSSNVHDSMYNKIIWTIYSPKLITKGINITSFLNDNILDLGITRLINPTFALISQENKKYTPQKTIKKNKKGNSFPFEYITLDSLIIDNGAIGVLDDKFDLNKQTFHTEFNVKMSGFKIDSNFAHSPDETIEQIKATIQLQDFHYLLPQNNYFLDIDNFLINTENKTLQIDSLNYYAQNTNNGVANIEKTRLEILNVPKVKFSAFSFVNLFNQKLVSDSIIVSKPNILLSASSSDNSQSKNPLEINLYQKTKKLFKEIKLSHTQIDDASIKIRKIKEGNPNITGYNNIYGTISNLIIDSTHQNDKERLFNSSDIAFRINDYELDTKNELYKIKIKELGFSTGLKKVYANLISMNPTIERDALAKKTQKEVKLVYFNVNELVATEFDFQNFLSDQKIIAERINIDDFKLLSYKNKHFPLDSILKIALPIDYMLNAKNYIKIDTVNINNSYIGVELLGSNSTEAGYFDITRMNASITGLSNDKKLINNGLTVKMKASGFIMDEGLLTASFRFPLNSKYGEYFYGGKLGHMNMAAFNPLLENLFFVSIRDGIIDSMNFNISANEDYAEGKMKFGYNNLKFDIRNKKKTDSLIVAKRGLVSMAANSIVKDNNPRRKNGRLYEGRIYFERDIYHSIFHYWTLSAVSGVQSTMGFKSKQLKERLKLEKLSEKYNRVSAKKKSKVKRKEKKKQHKEINKELNKELKEEKEE